jgi:hypothetical protein
MRYLTTVVLMLMTPMALLAAPKNSEKVTFSETVTIKGTQLPPGDYRVEWQGAGTAVEASILRAGKVVASVPATLVTGKTDFNGAFEAKDGENNSHILDAIYWTNVSLRFDPANAGTANSAE